MTMSLLIRILSRHSLQNCLNQCHYQSVFQRSGMPCLKKKNPLFTHILSNSCRHMSRNEAPHFDPNREVRRQKLMIFTYLSCFIGTCLLGAIGFREYGRLKQRAVGIKEVKLRIYGRRPIMFEYRGFILPRTAIDNVPAIHTFDVREDDIWVVTFPKAGTTWVQEMVYLMCNDVDTEKASQQNLSERFPYFEFPYPGMKAIEKMPSPRLIKSHLPLSLLPNQIKEKKSKIIYVARNPKDTVVSYYNFAIKFLNKSHPFNGTFDDYCQLFVDDLVPYGPWWKHVKEAWQQRCDDNLLILFYEDLHKDAAGTVRKIAAFLNKSLTESEVETIVQHCSFENMKNNSTLNYEWFKELGFGSADAVFMRKGIVGDWKEHLKEKIVTQIDEMLDTKLSPLGLEFADVPDSSIESTSTSINS